MPLIDLILNLAGLLLWLSWQAIGITAATRPSALSLVYTLKRTEPRPPRKRTPLLMLLALLVGRSLVYWQLGPGTQWTPFLNWGVVTLKFPTENFSFLLLYSFLSFGQVLASYYLALVLLAVANSNTLQSDPLQRIVGMQLGLIGRLPWFLGLLIPLLGGAVVWLILGLPLGWLGLYTPAPALEVIWQQALLFGLGTYLVWQYVLIALLIIHLFNSYVYLGNSPIWAFLATTGRNSLRPIHWLPLTLGRFDTAPLFAILLIFLASYHWANWGRWLFVHLPWR